MKAKLIIAALLWLAVPSLGLAEPPRPNYTTLVVEFVGETDRPVFPVLVSTSWQEGSGIGNTSSQNSFGFLPVSTLSAHQFSMRLQNCHC